MPLQRHRLLRLTPAAWCRLVGEAEGTAGAECLMHWARHDLPVVVSRQPRRDPARLTGTAAGESRSHGARSSQAHRAEAAEGACRDRDARACQTTSRPAHPGDAALTALRNNSAALTALPHDAAASTALPSNDAASIAVGLPAPLRWQRMRMALQIEAGEIAANDEFPLAADVEALLPRPIRPSWRELVRALAEAGACTRVYGSHGWQALTGLAYRHPQSDIDLLLHADTAAVADAAAAVLARSRLMRPRLDGEIVLAGGEAVAWREWQAWREGRARQVLVKRLQGVSLESDTRWLGAPEEAAECA